MQRAALCYGAGSEKHMVEEGIGLGEKARLIPALFMHLTPSTYHWRTGLVLSKPLPHGCVVPGHHMVGKGPQILQLQVHTC